MDRALIERAIDSAKARIYKLTDDEKKNPSVGHQKKIERQKEVMEVTVEALERMLRATNATDDMITLECRCKDCVHWSDMVAGATEHVKLCTIGGYMVGKNGYCSYGEKEMKGEEHE